MSNATLHFHSFAAKSAFIKRNKFQASEIIAETAGSITIANGFDFIKLDPPAIWQIVNRPEWGEGCQQWQMIQDKEDAEIPKESRKVYKREFYQRKDFENFLRDRYRIAFVKQALKTWDNPL